MPGSGAEGCASTSRLRGTAVDEIFLQLRFREVVKRSSFVQPGLLTPLEIIFLGGEVPPEGVEI
jgi:hypothetical protein